MLKKITFENTEYNKILIITDIHHCIADWCNSTLEERMKSLTENVKSQYEKDPFDVILCLGDYSLDFWSWGDGGTYLHNPPVSNTDAFMKNIYLNFRQKRLLFPETTSSTAMKNGTK